MKRYTINIHFDMVITEIVVAETYDEARRIAEQQAENRSLEKHGDCCGVDSCLVDEEDID